jgi:hypothetical protein
MARKRFVLIGYVSVLATLGIALALPSEPGGRTIPRECAYAYIGAQTYYAEFYCAANPFCNERLCSPPNSSGVCNYTNNVRKHYLSPQYEDFFGAHVSSEMPGITAGRIR